MKSENQKTLRILHLEDTASDHLYVRATLASESLVCEFDVVKTRDAFEQALGGGSYDLIISDYSLPSFDGGSALKLARSRRPEIPFLFFSGTIGEELAVDSLKAGAVDYVLKQRPERLAPAIVRALRDAEDKARLQQAESHIRDQAALLDKASDAIILCDLQTHVRFWNAGSERIYGWTAAEAAGRTLEDLLYAGTVSPDMLTALESARKKGEWAGELEQLARHSRPITVEGRLTLICDEEGQAKSLLVINSDITERKSLEEQFLRAQRMESLGILVSGIAHDLNNALAPVLIGTNLLLAQAKEDSSIISMIEKSARRGADMVKQVLEFARGAETRKSAIRIDRLVHEMGKTISDVFPKTIRCRTVIGEGTFQITGVPTQLHQVLMNLCVNARDAMPQGGTLTLSTENVELGPEDPRLHELAEPGRYVCLGVADTGTGIPPEQLVKVFQPFFTTKAPGKGTGLGLSTSHNIMRHHGGFIAVESEIGHGTAFRCYLPAVPTDDASESVVDTAALPVGAGECILVVDDEETVLAITKATLENFQYTVLTAASGPEAVAQFADHRDSVKLVLTDLAMPFMDGAATVLALRKLNPAIPIILTSGLDEQQDDTAPHDLKPAGFLAKPFTAKALLGEVHRILAGEPEMAAGIVGI